MKAYFLFKFVITFSTILPFLLLGAASASKYDYDVEQLQRALLLTGFNPGKADGLWGSKTEDALLIFLEKQKVLLESIDIQRSINLVYKLWNEQQEAKELSEKYLQEKIDLDDARHLLERVGIGANIKEVKKLVGMTRSKAISLIINEIKVKSWRPPPKFLDKTSPPYWIEGDFNSEEEQSFRVERDREMSEYRLWWIKEMIETPSPQTERLVLFWHNHFVSAYSAINEQSTSIARQNMMFRKLGSGNFKTLTKAIIKDPAMLNYLDNEFSEKGKPNENLSRELMELFVLGEGNYSEKTVREGARALTGYSVNKLRDTSFQFNSWSHDNGIKTIFGKSGSFNGDQFVDILFEQTEASLFLTMKFWRNFVSEVIEDEEEVRKIAARFKKSDYDIRTLLRQILTSKTFWSGEVRATIVKSPVDLLLGMVRTTGFLPADWNTLPNKLTLIGQNLFEPPNVAGWSGGQSWITPSGLLNRSYLAKNFFASLGTEVENMVNAQTSPVEMTKRSITLRYASEDFQGPSQFEIRLKRNSTVQPIIIYASTHTSKNGHDTAKFGRIEEASQLPWQTLRLNIENDASFDVVEVAFLNDYCCGPGGSQNGDRNFFVDWIKVDDDLFLATSGSQYGNTCDSEPGDLYCSGWVEMEKSISLLKGSRKNNLELNLEDKLYVERVALSWMDRFKRNRDWNEIAINLLNSKFNDLHYDALRIKLVRRKNGDIFLMISSMDCYPDCFKNRWPQKAHKSNNFPYHKDIKISLIKRNNTDHEAHYWGLNEVDRKFVDALWASLPQILEEMKKGRRWKKAAERGRTDGWRETIDYISETLPKTRYFKSVGSEVLIVRPAGENGNMMAMMEGLDRGLPYPANTRPRINLLEVEKSFGEKYMASLADLFLATDPVIISKGSKDISAIITDPVYNLK